MQTDNINTIAPKSGALTEKLFDVNELARYAVQNLRSNDNPAERYFSIMVYSRGENEYYSNNKNFNSSNSYLLFKSSAEKEWMTVRHNDKKGFYILFTEKFLLRYKQLFSVLSGFPFFEINAFKKEPFQISMEQSEMIAAIYKSIYQEYQAGTCNDRFEIISAYLHTLLLYIRRIYKPCLKNTDGYNNQEDYINGNIVGKFKSLIWMDTVAENNGGIKRRSVNDYAGKLFIHPNYLNALVKKETGKTAHQLIEQQVFNAAKALLQHQELRINEIAWQLSFNDNAHFNKFFKRNAGISPRQFRQEFKLQNSRKSEVYS